MLLLVLIVVINKLICEDLIEWRNKDLSGEQENLLFGTEDESKVEKNKTSKGEKFPHLKTKIWIQLVHDATVYPLGGIPPQIGNQYFFHSLIF